MRAEKQLLLTSLIFVFFLVSVQCKDVEKKLSLSVLDNPTKTYFVTKFDIGQGKGNIKFSLKQVNPQRQHSFPAGVSIGLLPDQKFQQFQSTQNCQDKIKLYQQAFLILWDDYISMQSNRYILQENGQQIWYIYLYDCQLDQQTFRNIPESIELKIKMMNNGSHFGEDQKIFWIYLLMLFIWISILIKYGIPIFKNFSQLRPDTTRTILYIGLLALGIAFLYKFLHIIVYAYDGKGILFLDILSIIIKNIVEGIVGTIIISIAWGWSIVHLKHDQTYIIVGTLSSIISIIGLILVAIEEQAENNYHKYDSMTGSIILIIRIVLTIIFIVGNLRSITQSAGKIKRFLKILGLIGTAYFMSWPLAVGFSELFLPNYMHHQFITMFEQIVHLAANIILCEAMSYPDSSYRKLSMKQQDTVFGRRVF